MFAQSSTFVVGAGASCELNLPSGDALMHKIASLLAPSKDNMYGFSSEVLCREIERLIPHTGVSQAETIRELKRAGQVIRAALPWSPSIDNGIGARQVAFSAAVTLAKVGREGLRIVRIGRKAVSVAVETGETQFLDGFVQGVLDGPHSRIIAGAEITERVIELANDLRGIRSVSMDGATDRAGQFGRVGQSFILSGYQFERILAGLRCPKPGLRQLSQIVAISPGQLLLDLLRDGSRLCFPCFSAELAAPTRLIPRQPV